MADLQYIRDGLARLRTESVDYATTLADLTDDQWDLDVPACPGWNVRYLTAHLIRGAESYQTAIERGLEGNLERVGTPEDRKRRTDELAAEDRHDMLDTFVENCASFERTIHDISESQLDTLGAHAYGPRTVTWFIQQRFAEVAFHRADLAAALGQASKLDAESARWLLPMLVESNLAMLFRRDAGASGSIALVATDAPDLRWHLEFGPTGLSASVGASSARTVLSAGAADLADLLYNRTSLSALEDAALVSVEGDRSAVESLINALKGP